MVNFNIVPGSFISHLEKPPHPDLLQPKYHNMDNGLCPHKYNMLYYERDEDGNYKTGNFLNEDL